MSIFDTTMMIDYLRGKSYAKEIVKKHSEEGNAAITTITCYELVKGLRSIDEEELLEMLFSRVQIYPLDIKASKLAGNLQKSLRGNQLSDGDALIMGIVLANDQVLVTSDTDFEILKSKKIIFINNKNRRD